MFQSDVPRPRTRVDDESAIEAVYRLGDVLGKGTFGVVREVTHKTTGKQFAMKIVIKDKVDNTLSMIAHDSIFLSLSLMLSFSLEVWRYS